MEAEKEFDLQSLEEAAVELLHDGEAFGTWGTVSSIGTGSCPASTAGSAATASS